MDEETKIWHILIDNQKLGPFSVDELLREPTPEKFTKNSLVWKTGMISWRRAADVPEFSVRFDPVEKESAEAAPESVPQESAGSFESGDESPKVQNLNRIIKESKNNLKNLWKNNPLIVTGAAAAVSLIFIFLTFNVVNNFVENKREEKELALEIERREREFKERQAQRDSVERVELDRLKEIRLELQKKAVQDSIARTQARRRQASSATPAPPHPTFTDPRDGSAYKIRKFGNTTWFLEDLDNRRGFTWQQALSACPKGWRLPNDREWKSLSSALEGKAGVYFVANRHWWSAADGTDSWYLSGGTLVCYSGSDNRSAVHRVRCVK